MATNTWSSAASTDWAVGANWSLGHAPDATEDAAFNGTSVINCSLTAASVCKTLTTTALYTGVFSTNGQTLGISGSCTFDNVSALTINSAVTLNADGSFHIGTGITSFTGGGSLTMQGTGNIDIDEDISASSISVTINGSGKTVTLTNTLFCTAFTLTTGTFATGNFAFTITGVSIFTAGTLTLGSSAVSARGNWTFGSGLTVTANTSAVTFSTNSANITCNGKSFHDLILNGAAKTYTQLDDLNCDTLTCTNGAYTSGVYNIISVGSVQFNQTDTLTLVATVTITGNGNFGISNNVTTFNSGGNLDFKGTGNIDIDKNISTTPFFNVTCGYSGKTATCTGSSITGGLYLNGVLTVKEGTLSSSSDSKIIMICDNSNPLSLTAGYTIIGNGILGYQSGTQATVNIPAIVMGGTAELHIYKSGTAAVTFEQNGDITTSNIEIRCDEATNSMVYNTNNNALTGDYFYTGGAIAGCTITINYGSSVMAITQYRGQYYELGTTVQNFSTSTWTCAGNWLFGVGHTINHTSDVVTFSGGGVNITSNGSSFYTVISDNAGFNTVQQDNLICNTLTTVTGTYSTLTFNITSTGSVLFNHTGSIRVGGIVTILGDGDFHIGSTVTTIQFTDGSLDLKGTGNIDIDENMITEPMLNLTCGYPGKVTTLTGTGPTYFNGVLTVGTGTLTLNTPLIFKGDSVDPIVSQSGTINGTSTLTFDRGLRATITIPALTLTGTVSLIIDKTIASALTYNLSGNLSVLGSLTIRDQHATGAFIFNTGLNPYYNISCGALYIGGNAASTVSTFNFNSSTVTCSSYDGSVNNTGTTITVNLGSSVWTCTGNWVWNSNATVDAGTSIVTFSTNTLTVTSNGKAFYSIFSLSQNAKTLTFTGALSCTNFTVSTAGATIDFPDADSSISGIFLVKVAGATCNFYITKTYTIGTWNVNGTVGNLITVQKKTGVGQWILNATTQYRGTSRYTTVADSDATPGIDMVADSVTSTLSNTTAWSSVEYAGWPYGLNGISNANIMKINGIPFENIKKVSGF